MTARARVRVADDMAINGIAIYLAPVVAADGTIDYLLPGGELARVDPGLRVEELGPSLRLSDDAARALLDALLEHYGGGSAARALRADLLHERDRVDKLIGHLLAADAVATR